MSDWACTKPCNECPWRRTAKPGQFPPERYEALAETAKNFAGFPQRVFACHKTEGRERACAGFLAVVGYDNITVRIAAREGWVDADQIGTRPPEMYASYAEMARANGYDPEGDE